MMDRRMPIAEVAREMTLDESTTLRTLPSFHETPVASFELDRFCTECGYNVRTLPIARDERTGIFVVRCTECGRYQPANDGSTALRPWTQRATGVLLGGWMLLMVVAVFNLGLGEGAISYTTLDELTIPSGYVARKSAPNATTFTWSGSRGPLQIQPEFEHRDAFIATMLGLSALTAFALGTFCMVMFPHWPRGAAISLVVIIPLLAGAIVAMAWNQEAPHLFGWGAIHIAGHLSAQLGGGVLGVFFGRPAARLAVRIGLPPSVRPRLSYLWLTDGKPAPPATG